MDLSFVKEFVPSNTLKKYIDETAITPADCILLILESETPTEKKIDALQKIVDGVDNLDEICPMKDGGSVTETLNDIIEKYSTVLSILKNGCKDAVYHALSTNNKMRTIISESYDRAIDLYLTNPNINFVNLAISMQLMGVDSNEFFIYAPLTSDFEPINISFNIKDVGEGGKYETKVVCGLRENLDASIKPFKPGDVVQQKSKFDNSIQYYVFQGYEPSIDAFDGCFEYVEYNPDWCGFELGKLIVSFLDMELVEDKKS